jgi:predicted transposase/invertase (TIGR01784 family)
MANKKFNDGLPEILLPTVDTIFKRLFGDERNKDILADFLTAVLGNEVEEDDIILVDPHLKREDPKDKLGVLDVKLRLGSGKIINIEMQVDNLKNMRDRAEYYIAKMTTEQLGTGDDYQKLVPVVSIIVIDDIMLPETKKYHCTFSMLEETEHFKLHDQRTIHTLELPKLPADSSGKLEDWLKFIKSKRRDEFMLVAQRSKPMTRAFRELEIMSEDEATRMIYDYRLKMARDERAKLYDAIEKGRAEGMEKGMEKERELWRGVVAKQTAAIAKKDTAIVEQTAALAEKDALIEKLMAQIDKA